MKNLPEIEAAYGRIDGDLEQQRDRAVASGSLSDVPRLEGRQRINDQAYFVLSWGQIESEIDERCRNSIRKRQSSVQWHVRRGWDLYNPNDRRLSGLSFEDRARLVLDGMAGKGSPWSLLMNYYQLRNQIADGTLVAHRIDVSAVAADFYVIQAALASD
jgi:hypothetical protein